MIESNLIWFSLAFFTVSSDRLIEASLCTLEACTSLADTSRAFSAIEPAVFSERLNTHTDTTNTAKITISMILPLLILIRDTE